MGGRAMRAMRAMRGLLWRGARAAARLLGSVRVRLTLWYLLILAIVFLVFGAVVYTTTRSEAASAERASLAAEAQQLLGAYDASDGRLHVTDPWANGQIAPAKARFGAGYPLDRQDVAVLIGPNGEVAQSLGPVTPGAVAALRTWQETLTAKATGSGQPALTGLVETLALDVREAKPLAPDAASASVSLPPIEQSVTAAYAATLVEVHSGGQHAGWLVIATPSQANRTLSALVPGLLIAGPLTLLIAA